ncbi:MAG TPA: hypothetical protein VIE37_06425 [Methylomirabilota bacterium]|jgi:hypothetical protein
MALHPPSLRSGPATRAAPLCGLHRGDVLFDRDPAWRAVQIGIGDAPALIAAIDAAWAGARAALDGAPPLALRKL